MRHAGLRLPLEFTESDFASRSLLSLLFFIEIHYRTDVGKRKMFFSVIGFGQ